MGTHLKIFFLALFLSSSSLAMNAQQPPVPTVQQQIEIREATECEQKVMDYEKKLDEHPNSPYFKFMLRLWEKRCPNR